MKGLSETVTSIAVDAVDILPVLSQLRDRDSLVIVSRVLESQITVLQAQLNQIQQVHGAVQERLKSVQ
jgi:hypothetical protein